MEVGKEYSSYEEFVSKLQALQRQIKSVFLKRTSTKNNSENFLFKKVRYKCEHGDVPRQYKATTRDHVKTIL